MYSFFALFFGTLSQYNLHNNKFPVYVHLYNLTGLLQAAFKFVVIVMIYSFDASSLLPLQMTTKLN